MRGAGAAPGDYARGQFIPRMSVIPLTVFLSLGLVLVFVVLFLREQRRRSFASAERDSLLPLAEERPVVQPVVPAIAAMATEPAHDHDHADDDQHHHDHAHQGHGRCGCRTGERPPCAGCLRRPAAAPAL